MKLIKEVEGFPNLKISYKPKLPNDVYGLCHPDKGLIEISLKQNNTQEMLESSLYHELIHLLLYRSGWGEILETSSVPEEGLVLMLENGFQQLIKFKYQEDTKELENKAKVI